MKLTRLPKAPPPATFSVPYHYAQAHSEWRKFLIEAN